MGKAIQKTGAAIAAAVLLFACASAQSASGPASYEADMTGASERSGDNRMIAYSVSLALLVKNIETTQEALSTQVKNYNGFIIGESENHVAARIPAENMDAFINAARGLGKVEDETKNGTDITDQYRDNLIRLESLRNVRDRYLALLEKADSVSDIISIEKELERINTEIEILEGRIKYAELSVEYSAVTVRFKERAKPGPLGWVFYGFYRGIRWLFVWN